MHLEGGRLPDVAGGDAQQQEAGEAGGGQQQRWQQRQRLPGHGCAGGPGVHGAAAGSREAERGRGTAGLAPGAGTGPRRPRPRRDGPPTSSPPRAQVRVSVAESPAPPLSAPRPQPRHPAHCPLSSSCLLCPRVIPPDRTTTPTSKSLPRWAAGHSSRTQRTPCPLWPWPGVLLGTLVWRVVLLESRLSPGLILKEGGGLPAGSLQGRADLPAVPTQSWAHGRAPCQSSPSTLC